jgi:hypothetical protein
MEETKLSSDAFELIYRRYIKDDPARVASFQEELTKAEIARVIYDLRNAAGLSREQLGNMRWTPPSRQKMVFVKVEKYSLVLGE